MLALIESTNELLAKEGPEIMKKYKWARAFRELDKIKKKEKKRLSKLAKPKKKNETITK